MVAPIYMAPIYFSGVTSPGGNPQSAPAITEATNPRVTSSVPAELSPNAQDTSRAVTDTPENTPGAELADAARKGETPLRKEASDREERRNEDRENPDQISKKEFELNREALRGVTYKPVPEINRTQTNVIDRVEQEIIKQIPTDRYLKVAISFHEQIGRMFDVTA